MRLKKQYLAVVEEKYLIKTSKNSTFCREKRVKSAMATILE